MNELMTITHLPKGAVKVPPSKVWPIELLCALGMESIIENIDLLKISKLPEMC